MFQKNPKEQTRTSKRKGMEDMQRFDSKNIYEYIVTILYVKDKTFTIYYVYSKNIVFQRSKLNPQSIL